LLSRSLILLVMEAMPDIGLENKLELATEVVVTVVTLVLGTLLDWRCASTLLAVVAGGEFFLEKLSVFAGILSPGGVSNLGESVVLLRVGSLLDNWSKVLALGGSLIGS